MTLATLERKLRKAQLEMMKSKSDAIAHEAMRAYVRELESQIKEKTACSQQTAS
ncbi:hypothetical protein C2W64_04066 [Brevibacillus laterosporus]|nr:hypothetical protein [Brevibacillus laterosporus]RAP29119.1 hypothetical protein C2W64_04066 [Brevibacillus laterosporus]